MLPERPCLPPRPKAMDPRSEENSPPAAISPQEIYQASSAIYEEIKDDIVSLFSKLQSRSSNKFSFSQHHHIHHHLHRQYLLLILHLLVQIVLHHRYQIEIYPRFLLENRQLSQLVLRHNKFKTYNANT